MMKISKEAQAKIDAITPKMKFVNCVAAISKMAKWQGGETRRLCGISAVSIPSHN